MKSIGIIPNTDKDPDLIYTRRLAECIGRYGGIPRLKSDIAEKLGLDGCGYSTEDVLASSDILICLGGDGTFLKVARLAYPKELPILGINLGSMGFLTEIEKEDIESAAEMLLRQDYTVEKRMMLEYSIYRNNQCIGRDIALNDVVIARGALSRILHVRTFVNDIFVDSFPGDGLIVSSPTGSTAYSLSAGGPIVEPDLELILVTPICPHILYSRSFITTGDRRVRAEVEEDYSYSAMVTADGQEGFELRGGDIVEINKSQSFVKLIRIHERNFYHVLRKKIYNRGEKLKEK